MSQQGKEDFLKNGVVKKRALNSFSTVSFSHQICTVINHRMCASNGNKVGKEFLYYTGFGVRFKFVFVFKLLLVMLFELLSVVFGLQIESSPQLNLLQNISLLMVFVLGCQKTNGNIMKNNICYFIFCNASS